MRPAPGRDWIEFDGTTFDQYPATTRESHEFKVAAPIIPYRLPELIKAVAAGQTICIAEAELKCDVIACFGFVATCCAGGAGKWLLEHSAYLTDADVVLLPDNDEAGRDHMTAVAESLLRKARRIRVLTLPNLPEKGDVVDWLDADGDPDVFARLVDAAPDYIPDEAAGPQPLMRPLPPPEPFPLDALGPELAAVAQAICDLVESPIEMCAGAVLASVSFAASAYIDIRLPTGQTKPVSCWFWCVAETGERKTATDDHAFEPQTQRERSLEDSRQAELEPYRIARAKWEARKKSLEKQYKGPEAGSEAHGQELALLGPEPEEPLDPTLTATDFTYEGMVRCLRRGQPVYGVIGSEGGQFLGGHGMADEAKLRTITGMSSVWDGKSIKFGRRKPSPSTTGASACT
jgi:hypothetical protein